MTDNLDEGQRGATTIIPSARKPINSKTKYVDNMAHYTYKNNPNDHFPLLPDKGPDEVDNILSKPVGPSPVANRKLPSGRALDEESTDSDSDSLNETVLSSSPPRSTSSLSKNDGYVPESSNFKSSLVHNLKNSYNNETRRNSVLAQQCDNLNALKRNNTPWVLTAVLSAIVLAIYLNFYYATTQTSSSYDSFSFINDLKNLGLQYKMKDDSLLQVQSGINTIFKKRDTGSFIFTYDSNMHNFDPSRFNKFMENIARAASRYLRNNTKDVQHVVLDNFQIIGLKSDYELIEKFRNNVDNQGVLLVKNVEKIPSELAMAFHYYCDEFNPLVKKSAIFFTLNVAECSSSSNQKATHAYIEKCLKTKWKNVQVDKIGPLLNRVVNIVVDVISV